MASTYNVQIEDSEGNKYCPKPDLLTTKEQVTANTKAGKSVDALVVKTINNKVDAIPTFLVDSTGKITGYKTGVPIQYTLFSDIKAKKGSFTAAKAEEHSIQIGFVPSLVLVYAKSKANQFQLWLYVASQSTSKYSLNDNSFGYNIGTVGTYGGYMSVGSTTKWRNGNNAYYDGITINWLAVG